MATKQEDAIAAIDAWGAKLKTKLDLTREQRNAVKGTIRSAVFIETSDVPGSVLGTDHVIEKPIAETPAEVTQLESLGATVGEYINAATGIVRQFASNAWTDKGSVASFPLIYPKGRFYSSGQTNKVFYYSVGATFTRSA